MKGLLKKIPGIRLQLLLALTGVVTTAFLGSIISWVVYRDFSQNLTQVSNVHLPSIVNATDLSGKGVALVSAVPTLVRANNELKMNSASISLQKLLTGMREILKQPKQLGTQTTNIHLAQDLVNEIEENLELIRFNVNQRLILESQNYKSVQRLIWLQADFQDEIRPIISDANFNVRSFSKKLQDKAFNTKNASMFNQMIAQRQSLLELLADGNLVVSMLLNIDGSNHAKLVINQRLVKQRFEKINASLSLIQSIPSTISLRQLLQEYESITRGSLSIFAVQQQLLTVEDNLKKLVKDNQQLIEKMTALIADKVDKAQQASKLAATESQQALTRGRLTLATTALVGLVLAIWLAWFYIGKNVMSRILTLNRSMNDIASGNLLTQVNIAGNDEITEMAKALLVFRDTALTVKRPMPKP